MVYLGQQAIGLNAITKVGVEPEPSQETEVKFFDHDGTVLY